MTKENNMKYLALLLLIPFLSNCTEQKRVKKYGGTMDINLPKNQKFVNATWKGEQIWYVHRPMRPDEISETYIFREKSKLGIIEGKIIFRETIKD